MASPSDDVSWRAPARCYESSEFGVTFQPTSLQGATEHLAPGQAKFLLRVTLAHRGDCRCLICAILKTQESDHLHRPEVAPFVVERVTSLTQEQRPTGRQRHLLSGGLG
jgi:hypothetical protein